MTLKSTLKEVGGYEIKKANNHAKYKQRATLPTRNSSKAIRLERRPLHLMNNLTKQTAPTGVGEFRIHWLQR